ncbi:MAG: DNA gyrase inhibitor YacG [Rubrivivax sp.]
MPSRVVTCPACKGPSPFEPGNLWRPFCSQRCRAHDLGAWASESYRVQAAPSAEDVEADPPADPTRHH